MSSARAVRLLALLLVPFVVLSACGGGSNGRTQPSHSPSPSFTAGKPGGTLRVVGTVRSVTLDPAKARDDAALLVSRLVYRQLYSYRPGDATPSPDLATGPPSLSSDRLTATITLRPARWNTTGGRDVTSGDVLRAMKRLCAPDVLAPERGYLSEVVVGYADFCTRASRVSLGAAPQPDLDTVAVPGLRAVGDTELQIVLRRPTADLQQILALPALSPLPFEVKDGFPEPTSLISDGPYRFVQPEPGETYRLSRNSAWDPAGDEIRAALVDRISFRGGVSPADVEQQLESNQADLSWDDETPPDVLQRMPASASTPTASASPSADPSSGSPAHASTPTASAGPSFSVPSASSAATFGVARVNDRDLVVLAVGARGPAAGRLATPAARVAVAACLDRDALQTAFGGANRAAPTDALLTPNFLDVPDSNGAGASATAQPSATGTPTPGGASPSAAAGAVPGRSATASPSASPTPSTAASAPSRPLTIAQCRAALTAAGLTAKSPLVLLTGDTAGERAAGDVLQRRFAAAGAPLQVRPVTADRFGAVAALGGWDLSLSVLRPDYAGSRAVLAPLLDQHWPGDRAAGAARRAPAWYPELVAGLAQDRAEQVAGQELALSGAMQADSSFVAALSVATVRTTGPNVGPIPPLALLGNADPANVALGTTRPGESTTPAPASS